MFRRGINREMMRMLQRMGVSFENLENVMEVEIKLKNKIIKLINPEVILTKVGGQKIYQISCEKELVEEISEKPTISYQPNEEDINLVMQQANATREEAIQALKETEGDIASAILLLQARKK
jgi:nascent polypeptide-associated complex subunit alpha